MKLIVLEKFNVEEINENFRRIAEFLGEITFDPDVSEINAHFAQVEARLNEIGTALSEL